MSNYDFAVQLEDGSSEHICVGASSYRAARDHVADLYPHVVRIAYRSPEVVVVEQKRRADCYDDLLEALKTAMFAMTAVSSGTADDPMEEYIEAARAAIAKAEEGQG
jgi:hypothetical protein